MTTKVSQDVVRLLFGDGLIAHENLGRDIEKVTGPDPDFITACVLDGRTWGKLESHEQSRYASGQPFNLARSAKIQWLRKRVKQFKSRLTDIRSLEVPQKSFTPDEVAALLHISPSRFGEMLKSPKGDKALIKHIREFNMPRKPMLVDVLLNAPITIQEGLDLIERNWRGWSPERQSFMKIWSMPETPRDNGLHRAVWSLHKKAICKDLNLNSPKYVRRVLRWPDVWAWRGLLCGQRLNEAWDEQDYLMMEISKMEMELAAVSTRIKFTLDKLG